MILDASPVVAIILHEEGWTEYLDAIATSRQVRISAVTVYEAGTVLLRRRGQLAVDDMRALLVKLSVNIEPFDDLDCWNAVDSYARFGKGMSGVGLNLGDGAVHALAEKYDEPVLSTSDEFVRAGLRSAL